MTDPTPRNLANPEVDAFFDDLAEELAGHAALRHPFLRRFQEEPLDRAQLAAYATQHYLYSRLFARNLAAVVSNVPDEAARTLLILNLYEEIGEPFKIRERAHLLLLEAGLINAQDIARAYGQLVSAGGNDDLVGLMVRDGVVTRTQVAEVVNANTERAKDLTHPALFRRFLGALGVTSEVIAKARPLPETALFIDRYNVVCRQAHWLEALGAMGPGTECVVPRLYAPIEQGIQNNALLGQEDYVFWTIHIHCDDGHGDNIIEAMKPYAGTEEHRELIARGARGVLDARKIWLDGLERMVFGERKVQVTVTSPAPALQQ